jgi:DNA-binding beta-propeller fold protein YncE
LSRARVRGGAAGRLAAAALCLCLAAPAARAAAGIAQPAPSLDRRAADQGIAVKLELTAANAAANAAATTAAVATGPGSPVPPLKEQTDAVFRFRLTDPGGAPLGGVYPAAWLYGAAAGQPTAPASGCQQRVRELLEGSLFSQADLDLNVYYVLTLNDDASLSVVDPLFGYGGSRLLAMVTLRSPGDDWALSADRHRLFVSMPDAGQVAVVDTVKFTVTDNLPAGGRPTRLGVQPDGGYLWVTADGDEGAGGAAAARASGAPAGPGARSAGAAGGGEVIAFDPRTLRSQAHIPLPAGPHDLAFSDDSRFLFVANRDGGSVTIIDVRRLQAVATLATGHRPVAVAWSRQAKLAYVSDAADGTVTAVAPPTLPTTATAQAGAAAASVVARIQAEPGLGAIAFAPDGRFGFVVNTAADRVHILDAVSNRIVQTAHVESGPDQVTFSAELAYIRHRGSETILTIPLKAIGQPGTPVTVMDVPGGQHAFGQGAMPSPAAGMARAPGANAMLIANPADMAVYYYQEGMAAPMGSFRELERQPRAVLVLDRSLHETAPGVYEATARLPHAGRFQLALFLDSPRVLQCFPVEIAPDPQLAAQRQRDSPPRVEFLVASRIVAANRPLALRFRLRDALSGAPLADLADVEVLFYRPPGNGRRTVPAHQVEPGIYAAELPLGAPGPYSVFVQSVSARLPFHRSLPLLLEAGPATSPSRSAAPP